MAALTWTESLAPNDAQMDQTHAEFVDLLAAAAAAAAALVATAQTGCDGSSCSGHRPAHRRCRKSRNSR